ncbi:hypothetical protein M3Y99_01467100 [Aphelenchoides fujianensis]|nr:hypothetical protein M3Y99_01467100 [Aphelenchoides fujianensis]
MQLLLCSVLLVFRLLGVLSEPDAFNLSGLITCRGEPHEGAELVFYEWNFWDDNLCAISLTDSTGHFEAAAFVNEDVLGGFVASSLFVWIKHTCKNPDGDCVYLNYGKKLWTRRSTVAPQTTASTIELTEESARKCPQFVDAWPRNRTLRLHECEDSFDFARCFDWRTMKPKAQTESPSGTIVSCHLRNTFD